MADDRCRVLVLGAHPDDAEIFAGGLIVRHCKMGSVVRIISVSDGRCGHHEVPPDQLVEIRREEAKLAGQSVGAEYSTWDYHDGSLQPSLELRASIIREIRKFAPDLVLTHRTNDYHPDHRAVGTAVQDASYLVTVPHVCPDTKSLRRDPVVASMCDLFTRPNRMRADVIMDVAEEFPAISEMVACHQSQVFQWLPYHDDLLDQIPESKDGRFEWLCSWLAEIHRARCSHFAPDLMHRGRTAESLSKLEVYEISEYATRLSKDRMQTLFPGSF